MPFYYEAKSLGKWSPRVTLLNQPVSGEFVRAVVVIEPEEAQLPLDTLWKKYSPDNRKPDAGGAPVEPSPGPKPSPLSSEEELPTADRADWAEQIVPAFMDPR